MLSKTEEHCFLVARENKITSFAILERKKLIIQKYKVTYFFERLSLFLSCKTGDSFPYFSTENLKIYQVFPFPLQKVFWRNVLLTNT